jgi:hypothetical protein
MTLNASQPDWLSAASGIVPQQSFQFYSFFIVTKVIESKPN